MQAIAQDLPVRFSHIITNSFWEQEKKNISLDIG